MPSILAWAGNYLLYGFVAYFLGAMVLIVLDRRYGVGSYRWYRNRATAPGYAMPPGERGWLYNQPFWYQTKFVMVVSLIFSLLAIYYLHMSPYEVLLEIVIALPVEGVAMMLGFLVGNLLYDAVWLRKEERSSIVSTIASWRKPMLRSWQVAVAVVLRRPVPVAPLPAAIASLGNQPDWESQPTSFRRFVASFGADLRALYGRLWWWLWGLMGVLLILAYLERHLFQPVLLAVRIYGAGFFLAVLVTYLVWRLFSRVLRWLVSRGYLWPVFGRYLKPLGAVLGFVLVLGLVVFGRDFHAYSTSYERYRTLSVQALTELPRSSQERVWPRQALYAAVRRAMNETQVPTEPHLVRAPDGTLRWSMAVMPNSTVLRFTDTTNEVISLQATDPSLVLPERGRNAHFDVGEGLSWSRNIQTCVALGRWFYQAATSQVDAGVVNVQNDAGAWVKVVPITQWSGWFFPRPEFGGVVVVEQTEPGKSAWRRWFERNFLGCGRYIPASEVAQHAYLRGQNIVPYEVTRVAAESLRFRAGFFAPTRWVREGDLRIADLAESPNRQPFALYFTVQTGTQSVSKLFHYVSLEPRDVSSRGLAVSYWAPADGIGPSFMYHHFGRRESLTGPTAVPDLVRNYRPNYNWAHHQPTDPIPYIRVIPDAQGREAVRFLWLVPIVTQGANRGDQVTSRPELYLVDTRSREVMQVAPDSAPETWPSQVQARFGRVWAVNN